eukprot:GILJ01017545.1.p1 GENE.GILJ01017545.1~~GILJ01017545.1.p1  ORF type:complete len:512 (+),score=47.27 GILJ01017545.1:319-1854(+)
MVSGAAKISGASGSIFQIRCACHVLQLMVKAILSEPVQGDGKANVLREGWSQLQSFIKVCQDPSSPILLRALKFPQLQETRWSSMFDLVEFAKKNVLENNDVLIAALSNSNLNSTKKNEGLLPRSAITNIQSLHEYLSQFREATLICESNSATMTSVLVALSCIQWKELYEIVGGGDSRVAKLLDDHFDKLSCPALVIVAFFTPIYKLSYVNNDKAKLTYLLTVIAGWLNKMVVRQMADGLKIKATDIVSEFILYQGLDLPPQGNPSERSLNEWLAKMTLGSNSSTSMKNLALIIKAIDGFCPSEAEVERIFRRTKLTVPTTRLSMNKETVQAMVKINVLRAIARQSAEMKRQNVTIIEDDTKDDEVIEVQKPAEKPALPRAVPATEAEARRQSAKEIKEFVVFIDGLNNRPNLTQQPEAAPRPSADSEGPRKIDPTVVLWVLRSALEKINVRSSIQRSTKCPNCNRDVSKNASFSECRSHRRYHSPTCVNTVGDHIVCSSCSAQPDVPWW